MHRKIGSAHVTKVIKDEYYNKSLKELGAPKIPKEELAYGSKLNMMGREAYFEEYFNNVKLENQNFPKIGPFVDPTKTVSFKEGYKRGAVLVRNGIMTEQKYNNENNIKNINRR